MIRQIIISTIFVLFAYAVAAQQTVGLFLNEPQTAEGYTLFIGGGTDSYLIDNCGYLVHHWEGEFPAGATIYLLENGNLLRTLRTGTNTGFNGGGIGGGMEIRSWDNKLIWQYFYEEKFSFHQHHDIEMLPNGNILVLAWEYRSLQEAIDAGMPSPDSWYQSTRVIELEPVGTDAVNEIWQWSMWDHLIQDVDPALTNYGIVADHPELIDFRSGNHGGIGFAGIDWMHCNAIEYIPEFDLIMLSALNNSEIYVIDHSTTTAEAAGHEGGNYNKGGDILYRYGNPRMYDQGEFSDQIFYGQHDVSWIPPDYPEGGGTFMVFNNGSDEELFAWTPPMDADGNFEYQANTAFGPDEPDWTFNSDATSNIGCSSRRLWNGNTLYCDARSGLMKEVTIDKEEVWFYQNPVGDQGPVEQGTDTNGFANLGSFRAEKYPLDYLAFKGRDLTPQGPIEVDPLPYDCEALVLSAENVSLLDDIQFITDQSSFIKITSNSPATSNIRIFDMDGKVFDPVILNRHSQGQQTIYIDHLKPGMYVLQFLFDQSTQYKRFIKY